jgi:uncharacterized membrane protein YgcG
MWKKLFALAVTLPMTITIASAQAAQDADIAAYSQDLARRIELGRQSGQLTQANYNSVQSIYNNVETIRRGLGNRPMNPMIRTNMMTSLTNLDKQLTGFLKDDVNSRYQMWDPSRRSWRNNWWQGNNSGANNFSQEIDAYQNSLKQRIDQGRASGRITRSELAQLTTAYDNIDRAQQQYRIGGFSSYERNSLMSMLTSLDKNITTQMHDDENSHYRHWNPNGNSWKDSWWKRTGAGNPNTPSFPGNRPGDGRPGDGRPGWGNRDDRDQGNWNRGDQNKPDWNRNNNDRPDWNRGSNDRPDWNRHDSNRPGTSSTPSTTPPVTSPPVVNTPPQNNQPSTGGTRPGGNSPSGGSTPSGGSSSGSGGTNAGTGNNPPSNNPSTGGTPPSGGSSPSTGTGTSGGRGSWGGGDRSGGYRPGGDREGGRNWGGSGGTSPQN